MTGTADGWNIAFYIFTFFRGVMFFAVVILIGTGWSYMKPCGPVLVVVAACCCMT